jgi:hypothetical protein
MADEAFKCVQGKEKGSCIRCERRDVCMAEYAKSRGTDVTGLASGMLRQIEETAEPMAEQFIPQIQVLTMPECINVMSILVIGMAKRTGSTELAVAAARKTLEMIEHEEKHRKEKGHG